MKEYISEHTNTSDRPEEVFMQALVGLHSFTGCDTVSAFAGKGKVKPLLLMAKDRKYVDAFARLGKVWSVDDIICKNLENSISKLGRSTGSCWPWLEVRRR